MNYRDYKQIMQERGLIESPLSVFELAEARRCQENIKRLRDYNAYDLSVCDWFGIDYDRLYDSYVEEKDKHIKKAIDLAWDKEETLNELGASYLTTKALLERMVEPTMSLVLDHYYDKRKRLREWKKK